MKRETDSFHTCSYTHLLLLLSDEVGETEESINQSINGACCHLLFVVRPDDLDLVRLE